MPTSIQLFARLTALFLLVVAPLSAAPEAKDGGTKAKVELISSVVGIKPGSPFEVGIRFELVDGWHIYWKNSGDSGQPPRVTWELPDGFKAGDLQFPIPTRHVTGGMIVTNILEGAPILPVEITPPEAMSAGSASIKGKVRYLICQKTCILETADVSLKLPILTNGAEPEAANTILFKRAKKALPERSSKFVTISPRISPADLTPGKAFELALETRIKRGYHIQSHTPSNEAFIACDVFMELSDGVTFDNASYPPAKKRQVKYLGELSEYEGTITIKIPGKLENDAKPGPRKLAGILKYQACNDKGTCMPPTALAFAVGKDNAQKVGALPTTTVEKLTQVDTTPTEIRTTPNENESAAPLSSDESDTSDDDVVKSESPQVETASEGGLEGMLAGWGLPGILLGCFVFGFSINLTPCVLPLLSIKILGFVQQAHGSRARTFVLGLAFGAGVMILFIVLGFLAMKGSNVLQHPEVVIALGAILTAMALSMLGVFTLQVPTSATKLDATIHQEGIFASFGKGALAPVLGLACTGPFFAGMFGLATKQPPNVAFFAFLVTGLGMASPYMLMGANPGWLSFLPKPGNWMITFERIMGFLLLAMVVWMIHPLFTLVGSKGMELTLVFLVVIAMSCWIIGKINFSMPSNKRWSYRAAAASLTVVSAILIYGWIYPLGEAVANNYTLASVSGGNANGWKYWRYWSPASSDGDVEAANVIKDLAWKNHIPWQTWSNDAVAEAVDAGKCAFVDFTAAYCTVCKENKAVATETEDARAKMKALDVIPFQGDFSHGDDNIFAMLQANDRAGVPLNLIYPPGKPEDPIVLRPQLTKSYLLEKIDEACGGGSTAQANAATSGT